MEIRGADVAALIADVTLEILETMSARVLVEASLLDPFLRRKLRPGAELTDEDEARTVRRASQPSQRRAPEASSARDLTWPRS